MSFSYNPAGFADPTLGTYPGSTRGIRWQVRLLSHDTTEAAAFLQDEEIDLIQTQEMNVYTMAARALDVIIGSSGGIQKKKISEFDVTYDLTQLRQLAANYRARGLTYQVPYAGGISKADKSLQEQDPDAVKPAIFRGLEDNPKAPDVSNPKSDPLTGSQ